MVNHSARAPEAATECVMCRLLCVANCVRNVSGMRPTHDGEFNTGQGNNMRRFCMDRHNGFVNCLFLDFSVRKVGLKELWQLTWHREWTQDINDRGLPVWPEWMERFKDY